MYQRTGSDPCRIHGFFDILWVKRFCKDRVNLLFLLHRARNVGSVANDRHCISHDIRGGLGADPIRLGGNFRVAIVHD